MKHRLAFIIASSLALTGATASADQGGTGSTATAASQGIVPALSASPVIRIASGDTFNTGYGYRRDTYRDRGRGRGYRRCY